MLTMRRASRAGRAARVPAPPSRAQLHARVEAARLAPLPHRAARVRLIAAQNMIRNSKVCQISTSVTFNRSTVWGFPDLATRREAQCSPLARTALPKPMLVKYMVNVGHCTLYPFRFCADE